MVLEGLLLACAAVIVTFNSEEAIGPALESLSRMAAYVLPVVVDNASTDRTLERVRSKSNVHVISNRENRGFAAAANQGIQATDAEIILLMNPDVNLLTAVDSLVDATRSYGLASGKLVDLNLRPQTGFSFRRFPTPAALIFETCGLNRLFPWNPVNRRYRCLDLSLEEFQDVDQPAGAFLMFRRDVWIKLGGFDEGYHPIWFEDVDFCYRAVNAGYRIRYVPNVNASHAGGHSIGQIGAGCRAMYWCVSLLRYAAKHFRSMGYRGVCGAVVFSSIPRMLAAVFRERSLAPVAVYSKILWFAGLCLVSSRRRGAGERTS